LLELTLEGLRDKLKLAKGADARRLLKLSLRLTTLRRACEFNIGAGHLAGWSFRLRLRRVRPAAYITYFALEGSHG
jgi:hypothetical protein